MLSLYEVWRAVCRCVVVISRLARCVLVCCCYEKSDALCVGVVFMRSLTRCA